MILMAKNHLKSIRVPKTWPSQRKTKKFVTRPNPGGHKMADSVPLSLLFTDMIGVAHSARGVRFILTNETALVNGNRKYRPDASIGLFDIITFPSTKTTYRVLINKLGKLIAVPVSGKDAKTVLSKITSKTLLPKKKVQLGMHNGRTLIVKKDNYKVGDTILLEDNKESDHISFDKGAIGFLIAGSHVGEQGTIEKIALNHITIKVGDTKVVTAKKNVVVIGKDKSAIKIE